MLGQLAAVQAKIGRVLATKPEYFVTHPAELHELKSMSDHTLREFAQKNGWRAVRRVGGHQIEFYNEAGARDAR
jgi:hypothetical protein